MPLPKESRLQGSSRYEVETLALASVTQIPQGPPGDLSGSAGFRINVTTVVLLLRSYRVNHQIHRGFQRFPTLYLYMTL